MDEQEFVDGFRPTLMEVVAAWYRGATFVEVLKMTSVFEVREVVQICGVLSNIL